MAVRLADDEVTLTVGGHAVRLRPSLRAAMRLERRHNGFDKLALDIAEGNVTTIAGIIAEAGDNPSFVPAIFDYAAEHGLGVMLSAVTAPLSRFVYALAGIDPDDAPKAEASAAPITFAEHHARLYRIATGWLGWTPAEAWNATPAEIIEAQRGRIDLLSAIFGGTDDKPDDTPARGFGKLGNGVVKVAS